MAFFKVRIKQQIEGRPGFAEDEEWEVQLDSSKITLFNKSEDDKNITFVRLSCGITLCVVAPYSTFVKKLQAALKADPMKVSK